MINSMDFREISTRGRVAFSINCVENSILFFQYKKEEWSIVLNLLWTFCYKNMAQWQVEVSEITPFVVCEKVSFKVKDYHYIPEEIHDYLQNLYNQSDKVILNLIDLIYNIGTTNLFVEINSEYLKESSLPYLQNIIELMRDSRIPLPSIEPFKQFPITENHGWGRPFTKEDILKYQKH